MYSSIILTCYNQIPFQAHLTMACIANITRYTDPQEYELILVSGEEKFPVHDDYHVLKIDQYIKTDLGYTASMNLGAKKSSGEILVFIQNDVFVWEGWLWSMRNYIEEKVSDCVIPDQVPIPRAFVEEARQMTYQEAMKYGSRDAGCLMITREAFNKMGGWNENLSLLAEKDFYERMGRFGIRQVDTCKVMITHIMAATNLYRLHENPEEYDNKMRHDAEILN